MIAESRCGSKQIWFAL